MDPDDHFDLATLFAIPEFDIRGIVLDCGDRQLKTPGSIPVKQMVHLTGREVPFAIGLGKPLTEPTDDGGDQPEHFQRAVALLLDMLRQTPEKVTVFTTGSVRDVAAAFNREPELLRRKIARLYINIGNPAPAESSRKYEYNVKLDRNAYTCIMRSGLPIYWCPCFDGTIWERGRHGTYWKFRQEQVLQSAPEPLQNWFVYALTKPPRVDSIAFLSLPQQKETIANVWKMPRNMWCTAPFFHAAGRQVYKRSEEDYIALTPVQAEEQGLADKVIDAYSFVPMRVTADKTQNGLIRVNMQLRPAKSNGFVFQGNAANYDQILTACLRNLFVDFGR